MNKILTNPQLRVMRAVADQPQRVARIEFEYHLVEHVGGRRLVGAQVSRTIYALEASHFLMLQYDGTIELTVLGHKALHENQRDSEVSEESTAC